MIKRATWFLGGAIAGVAGTRYAKRKVKATAGKLAPAQPRQGRRQRRFAARGHDVAEAVREGREAKRAKEAELRARLESPPDAVLDGSRRAGSAGEVTGDVAGDATSAGPNDPQTGAADRARRPPGRPSATAIAIPS